MINTNCWLGTLLIGNYFRSYWLIPIIPTDNRPIFCITSKTGWSNPVRSTDGWYVPPASYCCKWYIKPWTCYPLHWTSTTKTHATNSATISLYTNRSDTHKYTRRIFHRLLSQIQEKLGSSLHNLSKKFLASYLSQGKN